MALATQIPYSDWYKWWRKDERVVATAIELQREIVAEASGTSEPGGSRHTVAEG